MMNQAEILYRQAVSFAEQADIAKVKRLPIDYKLLYEKAYLLEKEAALLMSAEEHSPLPRNMMLKSAAALAYKAGKYEEAEKMLAFCRSENPDSYILSKLDEIQDAINKATTTSVEEKSLAFQGTITSANADEREIKIRDIESQQVHAFIVPANMFKNIVKSYWQEVVSVVGRVSPHGIFTLEKIGPAA